MLSLEDLVERIRSFGFEDRVAAARALDGALGALGQCLAREDAAVLAAALPEPCARTVRDASFESVATVDELYERALLRSGSDVLRSREETQIALRVVGESIGEELRGRIVRALPAAIGELLEPRARTAPPPPPHEDRPIEPPTGTLASGRPGSRHPLSEARPERAHSHSVVRDANPHADTKLSSTRGLTQERLNESLADGKPSRP